MATRGNDVRRPQTKILYLWAKVNPDGDYLKDVGNNVPLLYRTRKEAQNVSFLRNYTTAQVKLTLEASRGRCNATLTGSGMKPLRCQLGINHLSETHRHVAGDNKVFVWTGRR